MAGDDPQPARPLDVELRARFADDPELMHAVVEVFLEDYPHRLDEMDAAFSAADASTLARAAHTLKGAVGILCDEGPTATVRRIEMAARAEDWSVARLEYPKLKDELAALRAVLQPLLEQRP
jgi:HPt (histidine-containing phosphotransfer) domain-containing protein